MEDNRQVGNPATINVQQVQINQLDSCQYNPISNSEVHLRDLIPFYLVSWILKHLDGIVVSHTSHPLHMVSILLHFRYNIIWINIPDDVCSILSL